MARTVAVLGVAGLAASGVAPLAQAAPSSKNDGKGAYTTVAGRGGDGHGGEHSGGAAKPPSGGVKVNARNRGHHYGCHYPPSRTPQLSFSGPGRARKGSTVSLIGVVTTNGCPHDRIRVALYSSHDGKTGWRQINDRSIHSDGRYRFKVTAYRTHHYQVLLAAGGGHGISSSQIIELRVK